jgi:hypothetical protein
MIDLNQLLPEISACNDYDQKNQMLALLVTYIKSKRYKPSKQEKAVLSDFAFHELKEIISAAQKANGYKEKSLIFRYGDTFYYLIMAIHKSPAELSPERIAITKELALLMEKELYLENKLETIFTQEIVSSSDVSDLLERLSATKDEYEKGLFYAGLLHYRNEHHRLLESSKLAIADYMKNEMLRYIEEYDAENEDKSKSFEALCDACGYFISDDMIPLLYKVLEFGNNGLSMFAAMTLLKMEKDIPQKTVAALASDLVYAEGFYSCLKAAGKDSLFPDELKNEVYFAKSNLVHWLTYPTELGKAPDEIEYIGKAEFKKDPDIFIFKFKSDSDTIGDDLKGKWLIGWSNDDGDTFSNFNEYEKFDKGTPEKTVKYIKKKLL